MNEERKQEIMEFACEIIGIFEHLLDEKGISIPCADASDQEERRREEAGRIYGAEYYSLEDSIKATIEKHLENKEYSEDRIVVLDRRTSENPGKKRGGLAFCCNCGRTMFVDTWNMSLKECPECGERELAWEDESHKIVSEDFFRNNKKYLLSDTEC